MIPLAATVHPLISDYLATLAGYSSTTLRERKITLEDFQRFLSSRGKDLLEADRTDLAHYASWKLARDLQETSIKGYLLRIKFFFRYLFEEELYSHTAFKRLALYADSFRVEKGEIKSPLPSEEVYLLLSVVAKDRTFQIATFMILNFGLRLGELISLNVQDIDFANTLLIVRKGKGKKTRRIPILPYQLEEILKWLSTRAKFLPLGFTDDAFLILKRTGQRPSRVWLQSHYYNISKEQAIHVHAHRLRHTFACTLYYELKVDIWVVSWILGHSSLQTTMRYLGIMEREKIDAYREAMIGKVIAALQKRYSFH